MAFTKAKPESFAPYNWPGMTLEQCKAIAAKCYAPQRCAGTSGSSRGRCMDANYNWYVSRYCGTKPHQRDLQAKYWRGVYRTYDAQGNLKRIFLWSTEMIAEHSLVVLNSGEVGTVVHVYENGYEVETEDGALVTVGTDELKPL